MIALLITALGLVLRTDGLARFKRSAKVTVCEYGCKYATLQEAVDKAASGKTIAVSSNQKIIDNTITINKPLTIQTDSGAVIEIAGSQSAFIINPTGLGTTIRGFIFQKSDVTEQQQLISINADNVRIIQNQFVPTQPAAGNALSRAISVGYVTGLEINLNTFKQFASPAYIDGASGSVIDNYTAGSKGWVIAASSSLDFKGNTWGADTERNATDIVIVTDKDGASSPIKTNNYPKTAIVAMSSANNNAVINNQYPALGLPDATAPEVFVDAAAPIDGDGMSATPFRTIQEALNQVADGGIVRVRNGAYKEALTVKKNAVTLAGESREGVVVTPMANQSGGLLIQKVKGITIENLTIVAAADTGVAAVKVSQAGIITLRNLNLKGLGTKSQPLMGGIDINAVDGVTLDNVQVSDFSKSGIALTSQYAPTLETTRDVTLTNVTSIRNGRAGLAFYTVGNDKSLEIPPSIGPERDITGVRFLGNTVLTHNDVGIQISGADDKTMRDRGNPQYRITNSFGQPVTIEHITFQANNIDINNYQPADIVITKMNDHALKVMDQQQMPALGRVRLEGNAPTEPSAVPPVAPEAGDTDALRYLLLTTPKRSPLAVLNYPPGWSLRRTS